MSDFKYLAIFMFLMLLPKAISRECYQCLSTHSFQDCYAKQIKVRCLSSQECVTASAHSVSGVKDEGYVKGCAATCLASDIPICNNGNVKCDVNCCSSDYCNFATGLPPTTAPFTTAPFTTAPFTTAPFTTAPFTTAPFQAFQCYDCLSTQSFEDCDNKRKKVKCTTPCIKYKAYTPSGSKNEVYGKTCVALDVIAQSCNRPDIKCKVNYCLSNLCNGSSAPVVSGLLLVTAIVPFLGLLLPDI